MLGTTRVALARSGRLARAVPAMLPVAAALVAWPVTLSAQAPSAAGVTPAITASTPAGPVLVGTVRDEAGRPVPGARVRLADPAGGIGAEARADDAGRFALRPTPGAAGARTLRVEGLALGHQPGAANVRLRGDTVRVALVLRRLAVGLEAVQVTATPTARDPRAVAQSTTTVDREALRRTGGATLAESLGGEAGIAVRSDGPGATAPIIRGLSGERLVVLHDGVRAGDLAATAPDHGVTVDPLAAERIEVVRGPAALVHGSNAMGGVVHVVSGDVPLERPARAGWRAALQAESGVPGAGGALEFATPLGGDATGGWTLRARAGGRGHGDQRLGQGAAFGRLANTAMETRHGALGLGWARGSDAVGVAVRGHGFAYGMPVVTLGDAPVRLDGERRELLVRAETRRTLGPLAGARLDATAQSYVHAERVAGEVATRLGTNSRMLQVVARTRDAGPLRDGAIGVLALGRQNPVDGALALTPPTAGHTLGAFLFQELAPGGALGRRGVRLPVGVRWDRHVVSAERSARFGPARTNVVEGISGAAGVTVPVGGGVTLGGNLSRAVRGPSPEELYAEAGHAGTGAYEIGNPALRAEVARGADVVLRLARTVGAARVRAQAAAHDTRVAGWIGLYPAGRDTIAPDGAGGTKQLPLYRVDQRDARLRGAELQVEAELPAAAGGRVIVGAMADVVRARDAVGALPFTPPARLGGHVRWALAGREAGVRVRHALAVRDVAVGEVPTAAYTLVDLQLAWPVLVAGREQTLTLRVDNATDALWRDAASRLKAFAPGMGRNVVLGWRSAW